MKECDNSTRKIHISSNFVLSISLLIRFDTLLLRPSLHCNTLLHFTTLHPTTLHYTSPHFTQLHFTTLIDTSLPLIYTSLPPQPLHYPLNLFNDTTVNRTENLLFCGAVPQPTAPPAPVTLYISINCHPVCKTHFPLHWGAVILWTRRK
jgi:hypothetical protein